jgi:D-beta-D-heptose 7-phosphate kinase/D-beta-D-heptose 1-phosphate adenosyltransferase
MSPCSAGRAQPATGWWSGSIPFAEDTPIRLIEALCPEVLIKGADYTVDQVVGADFVQAHGGRVELVTLEQGQSTSRTIARIRAVNGES